MEKLPSISSEIDKDEVNKFIFNNFNSISPYFYKLISEWMSDAYKIFKDLPVEDITFVSGLKGYDKY
jgi:hypothetical protein